MDAKFIEQGRNGQLVRHRQVETLLLRAVAQGRVEDVELGRLGPWLGKHSDPQVDLLDVLLCPGMKKPPVL
jgi:hypothetical protein